MFAHFLWIATEGCAQLTIMKEAAARRYGEPRRLQVRRQKILRRG